MSDNAKQLDAQLMQETWKAHVAAKQALKNWPHTAQSVMCPQCGKWQLPVAENCEACQAPLKDPEGEV